jgi:hypothetical protein
MEVSGQFHAPASLPLGNVLNSHWTRVDPRAGEDVMEKSFAPDGIRTPAAAQSVAPSYTDWAIPAPLITEYE